MIMVRIPLLAKRKATPTAVFLFGGATTLARRPRNENWTHILLPRKSKSQHVDNLENLPRKSVSWADWYLLAGWLNLMWALDLHTLPDKSVSNNKSKSFSEQERNRARGDIRLWVVFPAMNPTVDRHTGQKLLPNWHAFNPNSLKISSKQTVYFTNTFATCNGELICSRDCRNRKPPSTSHLSRLVITCFLFVGLR